MAILRILEDAGEFPKKQPSVEVSRIPVDFSQTLRPRSASALKEESSVEDPRGDPKQRKKKETGTAAAAAVLCVPGTAAAKVELSQTEKEQEAVGFR